MSVAGALRNLASFFEAYPEAEKQFEKSFEHITAFTKVSMVVDGVEDKEQLSQFIDAALGFGLKIEKEYSDHFTGVHVPIGSDKQVVLRLLASRDQVCERRVVGTETVTRKKMPAQSEWPEVTEEQEIVEWDCEPLRKISSEA